MSVSGPPLRRHATSFHAIVAAASLTLGSGCTDENPKAPAGDTTKSGANLTEGAVKDKSGKGEAKPIKSTDISSQIPKKDR